jgi:RNA polymerase sigma-70 factor, ECF subfamily
MLRVKQGDDEAFAELVEEFQDRVIGILYHMLGDADEAEDLAQEVFLRVYRSRANYEPTAKFSTWLFTIVNNLARNAIRDRKRRRDRHGAGKPASSSQEATIDRLAIAPSGAMPSRIFAKVEIAEIVREAVKQLSPDQRLAMMLHRFEHMNYKQIADVMDKTEAAVKSLLARARIVLRDILDPFINPSSPSTPREEA